MPTNSHTDSTTDLTPRQTRALALLECGAVAFVPGQKWATVRGSGKATYRVSKSTGCTCQDFVRRGVECKHILACRALCDLAKLARREAAQTGRCTLPALLARALAAGTAEKAARSRVLAKLAADDQSDLYPLQTLGRVA